MRTNKIIKIIIVSLLMIVLTGLVEGSLLNGLNFYYAFEGGNGPGDLVLDATNKNNGSVSNNPYSIIGKIGNAFNYTGTYSSFIDAGFNNYTAVDSHSVSMWVKVNTCNLTETKTNMIYGRADGVLGAKDSYYMFYEPNTCNLTYILANALPTYFYTTTQANALSINNWVHVVLTYDALNAVKIYINGTEQSYIINQVPTGAINTGGKTRSLHIGGTVLQGGADPIHPFSGSIDEFAMWNRALTSNEVLQLYNLGMGNSYQFGLGNITIRMNQPMNNSNLSYTPIINISVNSSMNLSSIFWSNNSGITNNSIPVTNGTLQYFSINNNLIEGTNNLIIYANDSNDTLVSANFRLYLDTISPNITLIYPSNESFFVNTTFGINYTVYDTNRQNCWYSNDSGVTNISLTGCANITPQAWRQGQTTLYIYSNDTLSHLSVLKLVFYSDQKNQSINITYPVNNTIYYSTTRNLSLNYIYTSNTFNNCSYTLNSQIFYLPGCYNSSMICQYGNNNLQVNLTYLKSMTNSNYSVANSSINFTVRYGKINITYKDLLTGQTITNNVTLNVISADSTLINSTIVPNGNIAFDLYTGSSLRLETTSNYYNTNIINLDLNQSYNNLTIYLTNSTGQNLKEVSLFVRDEASQAVEGALIYIYYQNGSQFILQTSAYTNINGQYLASLSSDNYFYKFTIYKDNVKCYETERPFIITSLDDNIYFTCSEGGNYIENRDAYNSINTTTSFYNDSNVTAIASYEGHSSSTASYCLEIRKLISYGFGYFVVYQDCQNTTNYLNNYFLDVSNETQTVTYQALFYKKPLSQAVYELVDSQTVKFDIDNRWNPGSFGLLVAFVLMAMASVMFLVSPPAAVIIEGFIWMMSCWLNLIHVNPFVGGIPIFILSIILGVILSKRGSP
jgi:hypothetical protein